MSNLTTKINQISSKINDRLYFSQIRDGEISWNLINCLECENEYISYANI